MADPHGDPHSGAFSGHRQMVGLMLSWRCPARCRHCAYDCGPQQRAVMSLDDAKRVVDCGRELPLTDAFSFVGGEPFAHRNLLLELCRYVKETCGYPFTISTNAFWATTQARATDILGELAGLGLRVLLVSVDDFHLEYIDQARIENCVNAALAVGLECHVQAIVTRTSRRIADLKAALAVPHEHPRLVWSESPLIPTGRAEDPALAGDLLLEWRNRPDQCSMLKVWMVDPNGEVSPCCGVPFNRLRRLGNAFEEPLTQVVRRMNVDPMLNALAAYGGPYLLIDLLATKGLTSFAERTYSTNCHACQTVLGDPRAIELIQGDLEEHRLELLAGRAILHEQAFGNRKDDGDSMWLPEPWYRTQAVPERS